MTGAARKQSPEKLGKALLTELGRGLIDCDVRKSLDLIRQGARIDIKDGRGDTALVLASYLGNADLIAALLDKGADIEVLNNIGLTPLMIVAIVGSTDSTTLLIERGASIEAKDKNGNTAAIWAFRMDRLAVVALLKDTLDQRTAARQAAEEKETERLVTQSTHQRLEKLRAHKPQKNILKQPKI